ncbi:stage V sporulation protein AE [Paramaledivibacter caminithermalis]|jgi:stage V sporulation protein AE|uniref:Stage V sporulation protein AE n=1 Tax=Paramaledivibacter caminithermalis (strain DSM 15212 / CIP 107654 / DViRD3) TaxID=1121301 RepID=A0A1M6Q285_PARC5|nr:stage V sporulation protein AE [Paramaledivibacter caminithermalis]SHK14314.1 stage V sporulation protein AE [Paramaledivibacter caminithermalis DSM 15212]
MQKKRRIIIVTDGDGFAKRAVERAVTNIGGRCISSSAGNPTPINGKEIVNYIKQAKHDPVVVMVDDRGHNRMGKGEQALKYIINHNDIEVLGVIAVASNTEYVNGVEVDFSITKDGEIIKEAVNKFGDKTNQQVLFGDTVDVLSECDVPLIVGIGDIGKMDGKDDCEIGAPIITRAMEEIINRSGRKDEAIEENK